MRGILALAAKDLRLLLRDKVGFFFTLFLPLIYCMFFGAIFSGIGAGDTVRGAIRVAVVDEDGTAASKRFVDELASAAELEVVVTGREEASNSVRRGERAAYIVLPSGFGARFENPFRGGMPEMEAGIDPARRAEAGMLRGILTKYAYQGVQSLFSDRKKMKALIEDSLGELTRGENNDPVMSGALKLFLPALNVFLGAMPDDQGVLGGFGEIAITQIDTQRVAADTTGPRSSYDISFPQGIIWGLLGCAASFGISFVVERTRGTLVRLRSAPISRGQVLGGKALACFSTTMVLQVLLFAVGRMAFGVQPDSYVHLALAVVSASTAFVGIMMLLSILGKTEQAAGGIGWAVLLFMAMAGGGMIPLMFMPNWLRTVSHVSPVKWSILAMEGAIFRGFSFQEMLLPCGVLLGVGGICFAVGTKAFRWVQE